MPALTKENSRSAKRKTYPLQLEEYESPLLLAPPSAMFAIRARKDKLDLASEEGIMAMLSDMVVVEDGSRMFSTEEVPAFLSGLSADSFMVLLRACTAMQAPANGGDPGNSEPSTSAS